jgi:hypothetical protein
MQISVVINSFIEEEWSTELNPYFQGLIYISAKFESCAMHEFLYIKFPNVSTIRAPLCKIVIFLLIFTCGLFCSYHSLLVLLQEQLPNVHG